MATRTKSRNSKNQKKLQKVLFEFFAPTAHKVVVCGDFNNWNIRRDALRKDRDGRWKTTLELGPGRYEYRFYVDGIWHNDQKPVECVPNAFGTWNCVLEVS